jgi:hypothetical protein
VKRRENGYERKEAIVEIEKGTVRKSGGRSGDPQRVLCMVEHEGARA